MVNPRIYALGAIRDIPDPRDYIFKARAPVVLPPMIDLRPKLPPVYDQGSLGSCVGNGIAGAMHWTLIKLMLEVYMPSRLFIYYGAREKMGTVNSDSGASIRDGIKFVAATGVCDEKVWPYKIAKFKQKPPQAAYLQARTKHHRAVLYERAMNPLTDFRMALVDKSPIVIGFVVFESFYDIGRDGEMKLPQPSDRVEGGHCVLVVGYNDEKKCFICRNSWGPNWGLNGYFYMPYAFVTQRNYAFDFWVINKV